MYSIAISKYEQGIDCLTTFIFLIKKTNRMFDLFNTHSLFHSSKVLLLIFFILPHPLALNTLYMNTFHVLVFLFHIMLVRRRAGVYELVTGSSAISTEFKQPLIIP